MRFSWKALLLAPLLVPALLRVTFFGLSILDFSNGLLHVLLPVLLLMLASSIVSYSATIFLLLPSLYVLSRWLRMTWAAACLLGTALGLLMFIPVTALEWKSSGVDSGPPTEPFLEFLWRWVVDPMTMVFPVAGLITTASYWWLGAPRQAKPAPPTT